MKKALVTGGAGFIGSNIVNFLLEKGYNVIVLDDLSSGHLYNLIPCARLSFIKGDIRNRKLVAGIVKKVELIFHVAASVGNARSIRNPIKDSEVNVLGTLNVLEAAARYKIRKVVFSSSAGIFGELKFLPIKEDHPVEPCSPYGASKLAAEKLCLVYSKMYSLGCICLRYFNVYGINQRYDAYGNVIPIFVHNLLHNKPIVVFGDGRQTRDFINVYDVVQANYKAAMAKGVCGAFNIASSTKITINHLVDLLCSISGLRPKVKYVPPRAGDVRHSIADITKARRILGYNPQIAIEKGLKEYFDWARDNI